MSIEKKVSTAISHWGEEYRYSYDLGHLTGQLLRKGIFIGVLVGTITAGTVYLSSCAYAKTPTNQGR